MSNYDDLYGWRSTDDQPLDRNEKDAREHLKPFFEQHQDRYYKREAGKLVALVDEYANPNISEFLGLQGEIMVLEAFARHQFVTQGREINSCGGETWKETEHDLDFIFERDEISYGVEVKNTPGLHGLRGVSFENTNVSTSGSASCFCGENVPAFVDA